MKTPVSFVFLMLAALSLIKCKPAQDYGKYIKELDSLKVVTEQALDNFNTVDSLSCYEAYAKAYSYRLFLSTHLKDTVSKAAAESLTGFFATEKPIHDYLNMRSVWLSEAKAEIKQVGFLSNDLKNGSIETAEAVGYISDEKKRAEKIIEELKTNTALMRKHLEVYTKSLPVVEEVVRTHNAGILPEIVKPEIKKP